MKGQTAIEFLILLAFMILVFNAFLIIINKTTNIHNDNLMMNAIVDISDHLYQEVSLANQVNDDYSRIFSVPETINNQKVNIRLHSEEISISIGKEVYLIFLPYTINIPDKNLLTKNNLISKKNNLISIKPLN